MYELTMKQNPNVTCEMSYADLIDYYGRETFKNMLAGNDPFVSATPIDEDEDDRLFIDDEGTEWTVIPADEITWEDIMGNDEEVA